jgi:hypothetical protein
LRGMDGTPQMLIYIYLPLRKVRFRTMLDGGYPGVDCSVFL